MENENKYKGLYIIGYTETTQTSRAIAPGLGRKKHSYEIRNQHRTAHF